MCEIDIAQQAEDQREAAGDEEVETAQRDPVEGSVEKELLLADDRLEARRPDRENQPERRDDDDEDEQRPQGVSFDETGHARSLGIGLSVAAVRRRDELRAPAIACVRPPDARRSRLAEHHL